MSTLAQNVAKLSACISAAYQQIDAKGGTLPEAYTASNLSASISSIPSGGGISNKYGITLDDMVGDAVNGVLQQPTTGTVDLVFDGITEVAQAGLNYTFACRPSIRSVSFPDLTSLANAYSLSYAFSQCTNITSLSFPNLKTMTGARTMLHAFEGCTNLKSVEFPELTSVTGTGTLSGMFVGSTWLSSISFPKLQYVDGSKGSFMNVDAASTYYLEFPALHTIKGSSTSARAAFGYNDDVKRLSFPSLSNVTNNYLFTGCTHLSCIQLPLAYQSQLTASTGYATKWDAPANCVIEWI